jgi:predicted nuclease of predicted toxin-antitoxin system
MFPIDLAELFAEKGFDVVTARRLGLKGTSDAGIWQHAEETGSIVVSSDSDFVPWAAGSAKARFLHYRGGNRTTAELVAFFEKSLPDILAAFESGEHYVECG